MPQNLGAFILARLANYMMPGWDGEDAVPVSGHAVARVRQLLPLLPAGMEEPTVTALADGSFGLYWPAARLQIRFLSDGAVRFFAVVPGAVGRTEGRISAAESVYYLRALIDSAVEYLTPHFTVSLEATVVGSLRAGTQMRELAYTA